MKGYSYKPNGVLCSIRRCRFDYEGSVTAAGFPEGHGIWRDNSYHGEVLSGQWEQGSPCAPFVSRVFGSGAISIGLKIGYATCRDEGLSELRWRPRRAQDGCLRFGTLGVECSAAGGFLAHLPQLVEHQHSQCENASSLIADLQSAATEAPEIMRRASTFALEQPQAVATEFEESPRRSQAGTVPRHPRTDLAALIFVHGYNCPLDWACMRLGQLLTLGKFSADILPLVFSWPSGRLSSYFEVLEQLPNFAPDLAAFVESLRRAGVTEVHIITHSMGSDLVTAALTQLEAIAGHQDFEEAHEGGTGDAACSERSKYLFATITFLNATCPAAKFVAEDLTRLGHLCGRLTLYCDRQDFALTMAELLGRRGRSIGRCVNPLAQGEELGLRVDVVDCTAMDANVNGIRHSYFDLNSHVVSDLQELVYSRRPASRRSHLVRTDLDRSSNVFAFLAPPVFVNW